MSETNLPPMPQRPEPTERGAAKESSLFTIFLFGGIGLAIFIGLVLLTIVFNGAIFVLAGIFLFAAFHYLVWGWWLSKMLHKKNESKDSSVGGD